MAQIERNSPTSLARRRKSSASTNSKRLPIGVITAGDEDTYRCPAGEKLKYHYTNEENGQKLRRYWTNACRDCGLKQRCTTGVQRRIVRWEHEDVLEAVQKRLDKNPRAMRPIPICDYARRLSLDGGRMQCASIAGGTFPEETPGGARASIMARQQR